MKAIIAAIAIGITLPVAHAGEMSLERALRTARPEQPLPILLAEYTRPRATCKDDGRELPQGSRTCRDGRLMVCSTRGTWQDSGRAC